MFETKLDTPSYTLTVKTGVPLYDYAANFHLLTSTLSVMNTAVPLERVTCVADGMVVGEYDYRIKTIDSRNWKQRIRQGAGVPPDDAEMTFDVTDMWKLKEFAPHRALRDLMLQFIHTFQMTEMRCIYKP